MASEIIGLFTNPQQYLAAQDASMQQQFARNAQLAPLQRASMLYQQAGYQAGQGIGGALGGVDPQLEMISKRNVLLSQLDPSDPSSYMKVAQVAAQIGDQEFAMAIAQEGRKAASEYALAQQRLREKQGADPFEQLVRTGKYTPASLAAYRTSQNVADLELIEKPTKETPANIKEIGVAVGTRSPVYLDVVNDKQFVYGTDSAGQQIRIPYSGAVDRTTANVSATATLPGVKEFKDIPELRSKILGVVEPFRKAVNATDNALESLDLSITENNFIGFNAARVQLAKALAGGDLSQKEIAAAGGDPSIFGGLIDITSTAFTGTPSLDTQNKIKKTINAIRKVALKKGRDEIDAQRNVATISGFNTDDFAAASDIPEFRPRGKKVLTEVKPFDPDKERRYQEWKAKQPGATR
jgi:hypothetical protein